jgi:hypothetical protein
MVIIQILGPVAPELGQANLQPGLHVAIVMYDCSTLNVSAVYMGIVT